MNREQLTRRLEDQIGDMIDQNMKNGLGAAEWREIFDTVFAGMFGDGTEDSE